MRIRTTLELSDALDSASAWRKKEISALRILIAARGRSHERAALRRAAIPILYAHWEGFAREAATAYLELVVRQRRRFRELATNFLAIAARGRIRRASESRRISVHLPIVEFLVDGLEAQATFRVDGAVDTESNLSSRVLQDVLATIGVPYDSTWRSKELLVDGSLLKTRNDIAHGDRVEIDSDTYVQLHELVIGLVEQLKTAIENCAHTRAYLRNASTSS